MNSFYQQRPTPVGTEKYEAFDLVTDALVHLAEYNRREEKDERLLERADSSLTQAREIDAGYFKARYLQAMVKYLRGQREDKEGSEGAISIFSGLLKEAGTGPLAREISYNLAAAYSDGNDPKSWETAIKYFNEAIGPGEKATTSFDPELDLLARAGLIKTYLARQKAAGNTDKIDEQVAKQLRKDAVEIKKHSEEIRKVLRPGFPRRLLRLLRGQKRINWRVANKVEEVIAAAEDREPPTPRPDPRELKARVKAALRWAAIVAGILAVILFLLSVVVSIYLYGAVRRPL